MVVQERTMCGVVEASTNVRDISLELDFNQHFVDTALIARLESF